MSEAEDCLFCKIIAGQIPSTKVYERRTPPTRSKDINPKAKIHVLKCAPKRHVANVSELAQSDPAQLEHIVEACPEHCRQGVPWRIPSGIQHRA